MSARAGIPAGFVVSALAFVTTVFGFFAFAPLALVGVAMFVGLYRLLGARLHAAGIAVERSRWPRDVAGGTLALLPLTPFIVGQAIMMLVVPRCTGSCVDAGFVELLYGTPAAALLVICAAPIAGMLIQIDSVALHYREAPPPIV